MNVSLKLTPELKLNFGSLTENKKADFGYTIQKAESSDIDGIVKVTRTKENRKCLPWVMKVTLKDAVENPQKNILLVAKDGMQNVIGFIRLYCRRDKQATLHEIAVLDTFKGKGIGTKLLNEAEIVSKSNDCSSIVLQEPQDLKDAFLFYTKNGFKKIGEHPSIKRINIVLQKLL